MSNYAYNRRMSNTKESDRLNPDERREQILQMAAAHFAREDQDEVSIQTVLSR